MRACEQSLRRLQTDRIDLYQLHRPDFDVPIDETLGALTDLVRQGKVCYIGSSTAPAWKVLEGVLLAELRGLRPVRDRAAAVQPARPAGRERVGADGAEVRPRAVAVVTVGDGCAGRPLRRRQHPSGGIACRRCAAGSTPIGSASARSKPATSSCGWRARRGSTRRGWRSPG